MSTTIRADEPRQAPALFANVFLSYASEDRGLALELRRELLSAGVADVWVDREDIAGGDRWKAKLKEGLRRCNILLALVTPHSTSPQRDLHWIHYEHSEAERLCRHIIPLLFGGPLPEHLRTYQAIDFEVGREAALLDLRAAIARVVRPGGRRLADQSPAWGDAFVGREKELRELIALTEDEAPAIESGRRTIAIYGMGGLGKTMLAEELVRRLASRYPGGVLVEPRGQSPSPALSVVERWAELALGMTLARTYPPHEVRGQLAGFGELLVLIDDVWPDFKEVKTLLDDALPPDATRIITTRFWNASGLGCTMYPLGGLSPADAVELFHDRLKSRLSDAFHEAKFQKQADQIIGFAQRVDGHALALELAAGRCDSMADLPELINDFTDSLSSGVHKLRTDEVEGTRENSVAASLSLSLSHVRRYDESQHTDWERRFVELGVFPDGARMDREMIFAVWGDSAIAPAATTALSGLVNRSLVKRDETQAGEYTLHPLLRAYADQLLQAAPEKEAAATERFTRHVIERARAAFARPQQEWSQLEFLFPHVRSVGRTLYERVAGIVGDPEAAAAPRLDGWTAPALEPPQVAVVRTALDYAGAVLEFVIRRPGSGDRGRRILWMGLACARALRSDAEETTFLRALGGWNSRRDAPAAVDYFEAALDAARRVPDRAEEGTILSYLGEVQRTRGRLDEARGILEQALDIHRHSRNDRMVMTTLKYLGETYWRLTEYDAALRCYDEAISIAKRTDRATEGDLRNKIGSVEFEKGLLDEAIRHFDEALAIHRDVGNRTGEAEDLNDKGISERYLGRLDDAERDLLAALPIHREVGNRGLEAIVLSNLANLYLAREDFARAMDFADQSLAIAREAESRITECWAVNYQGLAEQGLGRPERARERFDEALAIARALKNPRTLAGSLGNMAALLAEEPDRRPEALALAREAVEIQERTGSLRAFGGRTLEEFQEMIQRFGG